MMLASALAASLLAALGCGEEAVIPTPLPTVNLESTVQAMVAAALPTHTPTPTPDIDATIDARVAAAMTALPTATHTPTHTPTATFTPTPTPTATYTPTPVPTATFTPTPVPTPTATFTPTPVPTATYTPTPEPTATDTPAPVPTPTDTPAPRPTATDTPAPASTPAPAGALSAMIQRARPAVVRIETDTGTGSGAIYKRDGQQIAYVITNYHVVEGHSSVTVTVNDSAKYKGVVLGTDSVRDLAVVRICCANFATLRFGDASSLEPGDAVVAIGYALALPGEATITRGIVSAKRYHSRYQSEVIQTDAAINPGNSGGPMLTLDGKIIGINTFKLDEASAERLGFAISASTVRQRLTALESSVRPPPTPTKVSRADSAGRETYGPVDGELPHDPSDGFIETHAADVSMADFVVEATFVNPYAKSVNPWDHGFMIRRNRNEPFIYVVVTSVGSWVAKSGSKAPYKTLGEGKIGNFATHVGAENHLKLVAIGGRGWFFVNGDFVSSLDLSSKTTAGDIAVITGAFKGGEREKASTEFKDFTITRLNKRYGPAEGRLEKRPGFVASHPSGIRTRDFMAEANFTNPHGRDWDFGFIFRRPRAGRLEVVGVVGNGSWFHKSRDVGDDDYTNEARGQLPNPDWGFLKTRLILIALGDSGWLFMDDTLLAELDLSHNLDAGEASVMGDFFQDHRGAAEFEDFNVWAR